MPRNADRAPAPDKAAEGGPIRKDESYRQTVEQLAAALESDTETGLGAEEAARRLSRFGRNELTQEKPPSRWRRFLSQFNDVLVLLLIAAAVISGLLWLVERDTQLPYEAIAILAIVLLNAAIGYLQEARATEAVSALRQMTAVQSTVLRDNEQREIAIAELVPGDVLLLEEGDTVSADARLIEAASLRAIEAALTGESQPVAKDTEPLARAAALGDRSNMVFSGTSVARGRGRAIITATGMRTEMGRIAGLLKVTRDERTPLQRELDRLGRFLGAAVVVIATSIIAMILLIEEIDGLTALFDVLIFGVAIAVAAVPEGLPAIITTVLAIGVQRMAARNAVIRHLTAVETLGSADVIVSDKTGTLTRNEMTVRRVVTASGAVEFEGTGDAPEGAMHRPGGEAVEGALKEEVLLALAAGARANNARIENEEGRWTVKGDPTEGALVVAACRAGLGEEVADRFERVHEIPFSSERKLMSTIHEDGDAGPIRLFTKGAPEVLLSRSTQELVGSKPRPLTEERRSAIQSANEELAGQALRTLATGYRSLPSAELGGGDGRSAERDLIFLGLIGIMDPPREEAKRAVARARSAGIRPVMVTGDHPRTAAVIARELGITEDERAVTGTELETMSDEDIDRVVAETSVFARVDPEHKLRIVEALRRAGLTVAMTGDGVNDAPALKTSDIGIAMGITGTDVSKEASDMVLADDNFATIVAAVEEGRTIFANIRKFMRYLLSSNIGEVMTMVFGVLLAEAIGLRAAGSGGIVLPLLATQILWINLVTDGAPALALGADPADPDQMSRPPRPRDEGAVTPRMWMGIAFVGVIMAAGTILVLDASLPGGFIDGSGTLVYGRTMAFTTLMLFQLFNVFSARSDEQSAFVGLFANRWLWVAVGLSLALHAAVIYLPFLQAAFSTVAIGVGDWAFCAAAASSVLWLREIEKVFTRRLVAKIGPARATEGPMPTEP
ncbi:cation-translocating P-type ATPase [Sinorhizobium alkalisoli]|uniref:cation-translocating P-type ATPase n=1 Tax=Sinorhizobium alkalisoli TaxID=1752398 RepID=UPI00124D9847|nr:cation-translocating P-type ATPase [Sinorhizobium alkalisoli]